ncbi:MAG: 50S ribosomal protein L11 methyltransferase [Ignavibacteria bacterium]|nr:50S ribosomal protein L11 methyltransferase [Ignavibacteria bacterium]
MQKTYTELKIFLTPFNSELLTGFLQLYNVEGILEEENFLTAYFDVETEGLEKELEIFLNNLKKELLIETYSISKSSIQNKNWNEEWEKSLEPIKVTDRTVIKPSFKSYQASTDEIVITIDPKMSFGTGYHQTTRLMIRLLEKYIMPNTVVLDVGCGTGVLSIAAVKLGAEKAFACDIDELCQENALENFQKNSVTEKVKFFLGGIKSVPEIYFDLILANINRNILIEIAADVAKRCNAGGSVILSGLLIQDEEKIIDKYSQLGFKLAERMFEDEWLGLVFKKS